MSRVEKDEVIEKLIKEVISNIEDQIDINTINMFTKIVYIGERICKRSAYENVIGDKKERKRAKEKETEEMSHDLKRKAVEMITRSYSKQRFYEYREKITNRLRNIRSALRSLGYEVWEVSAELQDRAIFGSSSGMGMLAFEVGLCFDPILNVPYIPASTVKGAVRKMVEIAVKMLNTRNTTSEAESKALERLIDIAFGSSNEGAGVLEFTDAYPVDLKGDYLIIPDVITPHYKDATNELTAMPNPVVHVSLAPGVQFKFYVGINNKRLNRLANEMAKKYLPAKKYLSLVSGGFLAQAFRYALAFGIGGRTAIGYGRMNVAIELPGKKG